jgi:phage terminase Nu1 subunit (DNA packaging protein)
MSNLPQINSQSSDILTLLNNQSLIKESDIKNLSECKQFILDTYTDVPMFRSLPVKLLGVLNDKDFPTPDAKYWQCKVEAEVHANELVRDFLDLELANIGIEEKEYILELMEEKHGLERDEKKKKEMSFDIRKQKILIAKSNFELKQLEKRIKYRAEEVVEWKKISETLSEKFGDKINPHDYVKHYIDKLKASYGRKMNDPELSENEKASIQKTIDSIDGLVRSFI